MTLGLVAGCLSGIIGTGSFLMLLPVLVYAYGPQQAVPIMAVAAVMANLVRVAVWWRQVDWQAVATYTLPGVPAAAMGARTLLALSPRYRGRAGTLVKGCACTCGRWLLPVL